MANEEHFAILRLGVKAWNEWRKENPKIKPDLSEAVLSNANLRGADLSNTNLRGANLSEASLRGAELIGADLNGANLNRAHLRNAVLIGADLSQAFLSQAALSEAVLSKANLSRANLSQAVLSQAVLRETVLSRANLSQAVLSQADLRGAKLSQAVLIGVNLSGADLRGAVLSGAVLSEANLSGAVLSEADLSGADLSGADLWDADLSRANLNGANLSDADLVITQALETIFTNATLTGVCIEDWNINSKTKLDGVICDYVYLKTAKQERRPHTGNFAPGEFAKLFQVAQETVDLIFKKAVDWKAFAYSFVNTQVVNENTPLAAQSIENKGDGTVVIKIRVPPDTDKEKIHDDFWKGYEFAHKALEAQYQARLEDKDEHINQLFYLLNQSNRIQKLMAETPKYDMRGSNFQGGFAETNLGKMVETQHNYAPEQSLASAAAEIQQLLDQLSQTNPTTTKTEELTLVTKAVEQIEKNPTLKARVINALKTGGTEAFKEAIDHPLVNILMATLEGWQEAE